MTEQFIFISSSLPMKLHIALENVMTSTADYVEMKKCKFVQHFTATKNCINERLFLSQSHSHIFYNSGGSCYAV